MSVFTLLISLYVLFLQLYIVNGETTTAVWTTTASSTRVLATANLSKGIALPSKTAEELFNQHYASRNKSLTITVTNTTARKGDVVFLPCETPQSMGKQVSWVRRKDWHILTSGLHTYTKEERFAVHHPSDSNKWTLAIKYVKMSDEGVYECQIVGGSTSISKIVNLSVVTPKAVIPGNGEYHVDAGSTISLVCFIEQISVAPQYIFWYHNTRMINYDTERGGINVQIFTEPKVRSMLTITDAKQSDSGKYTCNAANTETASITVYITQVNKIAAIQPRDVETSSSGAVSTNGTPAFILSILIIGLLTTATLCNLDRTCDYSLASNLVPDLFQSVSSWAACAIKFMLHFRPD